MNGFEIAIEQTELLRENNRLLRAILGQQYLKTKDVAIRLSVNLQTVNKLIYNGEFETVRVGTALRVNAESVLRYLEANKVGGTNGADIVK